MTLTLTLALLVHCLIITFYYCCQVATVNLWALRVELETKQTTNLTRCEESLVEPVCNTHKYTTAICSSMSSLFKNIPGYRIRRHL